MGIGWTLRDNDWNKLRQIIQKIASLQFGYDAVPTFGGLNIDGNLSISESLTLSNLTPSRLVQSDSSSSLASADLSSFIAGTANRVSVTSDGVGGVVLSAPQDIHSGASPTFANLTLSSNLTVNGNATISGIINTLKTERGILSTGTTDGITWPSGAGTRCMWIPSKAAFRAGTTTGTSMDYSNIGLYSFAVGSNNIASDSNAFSVGGGNTSSGRSSFTTGETNTASGQQSVALGGYNTASNTMSFASGWGNQVSGGYATAIGYFGKATGTGSLCLAYNKPGIFGYRQVEATGEGSIIIGFADFNFGTLQRGYIGALQTGSICIGSAEIGKSLMANANLALSIGVNVENYGAKSIVLGLDISNSDTNSVSIGVGKKQIVCQSGQISIGYNEASSFGLRFHGNLYSGYFGWHPTLDYFYYNDDLIMSSTERIYFYSTSHSIHSDDTDLILTTSGDVSSDSAFKGPHKSSDGTSGATGTIDLTAATSIVVKDGLITSWS